jgi:hypothetical protein
MLVFGGGHVWSLSLSGTPTWTELIPTGTPGSAVIYDPAHDRFVGFGGFLSLSGTPTWTDQPPTGTPPTVVYYAIYDPRRNRMVVFGGEGPTYPYRAGVWTLSLSDSPAWTKMTSMGTPPSGRGGATAIYDPVRDRMVIYGGRDIEGTANMWALSLGDTPTWTELFPTGLMPFGTIQPFGHL